jgi:hypothetical protein
MREGKTVTGAGVSLRRMVTTRACRAALLAAAVIFVVLVAPSLAGATVFLNAEYASSAVEPGSFGPNSGPADVVEASNYVQGIAWSSWGGTTAVGSGRVFLFQDRKSTSPVTVTLGGLTTCAGQSLYTTYTLSLAAGAQAPMYWPKGQKGSFPCHVTAALYDPYERSERSTVALGYCVLNNGLTIPGREAVAWTPPPPRGGAYVGTCATLWTAWASSLATGRGVMRDGLRQWPAKTELSGLAWCPRIGLGYSKLAMTLYGPGETIRGKGGVSKRDATRLRREIDKRGLRRRTFRQARTGCTPSPP